MPLPSPKLDDRNFADLLAEAQQLIRRRCPAWTDLSPGDPGTTLVEVFAYLTDVMLYRLNRLPEKVYVALLNILGVTQLAPAAAKVRLTFSRTGEPTTEIKIKAGTRVSDASGTIVFTTSEDVVLAPGATRGHGEALHCDNVDGELVGIGTGEPGQSVRVRRPPILRRSDDGGLVVATEAASAPIEADATVREFGGKAFLVWPEVTSFLGLRDTARAYAVDRADGLIIFAPARGVGEQGASTLAAVPAKESEIRVWYRRGGGRSGNVAAGTLTVLKDPVADIAVTNEARASGGDDGETVEQALVRGREAVRVLRSAVTARDFERVALEAGGIARARAYAQRDAWIFGERGVVEVQLIPKIATNDLPDGAVTNDVVTSHQTAELASRVDRMLTARRPVGVGSRVLWAKCRPVSLSARVVVSHVEDPDKVRSRLLRRINELLSPVGNWPFGKTLRASDVYEAILSEPGVRYAERLNLTIEDGPTAGINDIVRDPRQPRISYAATDSGLFRSLDSAESWTKIHAAQGERMMALRCHPEVPGLLAAIAQGDSSIWPVHISSDGGESWKLLEQVQGEQVYDAAWMRRDERPILLLATRRSLRRIELGDEAGSKGVDRIGKDEAAQDTGREGFYAVAAARHPRGVRFVALAAREKRGVLLSLDGGAPGTFELLRGAEGKDIRGLGFHRDGDRMFLWAAILAEAGAEGEGVMRIEARADGIDPAGWKMFSKGWKGGSCEGLDMLGTFVVAGSNRAGALVLDGSVPDPGWTAPSLDCGLPITDDRKSLAPVPAIAAIPGEGGNAVILAGTRTGLFASSDGGKRFANAGQTVFSDRAPLPPNWLYCSGKHDITVLRDSAEAEG